MRKLLLIFTEKIFTQQNVNLTKLDEQFQIAFQILINRGYEVLVSGDGEQSFEFAKRFSYIFQDENIKNTQDKLNDSQKNELIKNSNCIICFQKETVELAESLNRPYVFIDIEEKNVGEKDDIDGNFNRFTVDSLNAGEIVKRVEELISSGSDMEKENSIDVKESKSNFTQDSSDEFEEYKNQVKKTIEQFINDNKLEEAKNLISEYESIVKNDIDIYSLKAVIAITENRLDDAEKILKQGVELDNNNFDLLYNLAYTYKLKQDYNEAKKNYFKSKELTKNEGILLAIENSLSELDNSIKAVNQVLPNNLVSQDLKIVIVNTDHLDSAKIGSDIYENRSNVVNQNKSEDIPEVTIVVQGYNRMEKTKQCVEALIHYTKDVDYQLILIDNGSSDNTFEYFKSVDHNRKTIIRITKNIGAQFTGKYIRQYTQGKYLCVLANDIIVTKNWLLNLLICIKSDKRIGWAIPSSSNTSNFQDPGLQFDSIDEMQIKAAEFNISDPWKWHELTRNVAATALVRIELYDVVGMGDYGFFHEFGDDDLSFRTRRAGYKMILCKDTFVHHNHDVFNLEGKNKVQLQKSLEKGRLDFKDKYFGIDAWDDTTNFEPSMINMMKPLEKKNNIEVLGIDVRCGTPILEVKNKLRENGIFDVMLSSFFSQAKYWMDLKSICEGDVFCDRVEHVDEYFKSNRFDYILVGEPINSYKDTYKLISKLVRLIKPNGQALVKLNNTCDAKTFLNIIGNKNIFDDTYPSHISIEEMQKIIINLGGKVTNMSAELHIIDEQTRTHILEAISNIKIVSNVDEVFKRMLVKNYVFSISK